MFEFTGLRGFLRRSGGMMGWASTHEPLSGIEPDSARSPTQLDQKLILVTPLLRRPISFDSGEVGNVEFTSRQFGHAKAMQLFYVIKIAIGCRIWLEVTGRFGNIGGSI
jgi:hypothetical protein